jgi:integrase
MPKRWIAAAIGLTDWLHTQGRTLADVDQPPLDQWLADGAASNRRVARPFIAWLERQDRRGLRVPTASQAAPVLALDDHRRLAALRTLLNDKKIEPRLRLAGCLVALYAQPVARIVRLTGADLQLTDTAPQIRLWQNMVALPAQLGHVIERLLATTAEDGWLFAGQKAGRPMHPSHLARRLRRLGVPVASARPSALAALAHRIPAPVLADLLGFGAQTICKAGADLKVDYAGYVARRT